MSTSARTPGAGMPGPVWPPRQAPSAAPRPPGRADAHAGPGTRGPSGAPAPVARPAAPAPAPAPASPAATPAPPAPAAAPDDPEVPAEERPLDPRTIARASLAAGRNRSLWWTASGIVGCVVLAFLTDAVVASVALGIMMVVAAVVRVVVRPEAPVAVAVRSRPLDVLVLAGTGATLLVLASVLPTS